ncbi:hypothetical protein Y1Q_0006846 [Alligator mississippiensis]|uniref:C-type lectin domain-containing protein n=1 Tax=Alligator mississippiensis TaxID=8496 RepID=A0A151M5W6_ALLMI|nr:hypothetical protein Y1Q_0006846 [Alligator mississippiensis]
MAAETVYADLHIPFESPCPRPSLSSSQRIFQLVSKREEALAVPESDGAGSGDICTPESILRDFRSHLVKSLCHLTWTSSAEGPGCRLCPVDWQLHRDKCYWVSRDTGHWSWSREDCAARSSHLLMLHDREELVK